MTRLSATVALIALVATSTLAVVEAAPTQRAVHFAHGASSAQVHGTITGDGDVDHIVTARAGQTLSVTLKSSNTSLNFNVNPPGSENVSMFIGNLQGTQATLMLPADGSYVVRVYLMRSAARRHAHAAYTLDVAVSGQALAALPSAKDARVNGTPFHATATVPCQTPGAAAGSQCQAGVIRRGHDGTATVTLHGAGGLIRQLLLVKGQPVASDSAQPISASRHGDVLTISVGSDERYDVPDALLTGG
jgi:hypothetical protein